MAWTFNGTRIFVQENPRKYEQIIARLNPLNTGTVLHWFGYDDLIENVNALIVGLTDRDSLEALASTGNSYTLSGPYGIVGDFYVKSLQIAQQRSVCQTFRPDLDGDSPVYIVDMELYIDN